ncbi:MAG: TolC family outer membrane protein [Planktotalea sp.]|uniref:TolC family outer membrane protein n=1 Tax=Planktotalea sp. TaxID=2029877 RepID=UPI003C77407B
MSELKSRTKTWLAAVGLSLLSVQSVQADTLSDALISAFNHSGLLEQNRALLRAADEDVAIATSALRPILNYSASLSRNFSRSNNHLTSNLSESNSTAATIGISAELLLFDGGQSKFAIEAAKENVLATRARLIALEQSVLFRAIQAYMNVRRASETVALRQSNVRLITQELRAARDRFEVGEITRTDVALAEARLAASRSGLAAAEGGLISAQEEYRAAIGRKPSNLAVPKNLPKTASSVDKAKDIAVRNHPDMHAVQHDVAAADLNVLRANAAMSGTIKLRGGLNHTETVTSNTSTNSGSISLEANVPIYQGGRLSALHRQAMARRDAARGSLHVTRHQVQQNVGDAFAQLRVSAASRDASERQIRAARVAFRGVREEANVGSRTTLDVLNAEQELLDAQFNLIGVQTDEFIAAYAALASMGLLTAKHLNLPVQQYDPAAYYNLVKDAPARSVQGEKLNRVLRALGKE